MTKKQYIGAFLDGYFADKNSAYGFQYFTELERAQNLANLKWEQFKNQNLTKNTTTTTTTQLNTKTIIKK